MQPPAAKSGNEGRGVHYGVLATLPTEALRDQYRDWLAGGHVQEVVRCGALHASVVVLDGTSPWRVLALYRFGSRAELDRYLQDHAPRLRAQGLALFGPTTGVTFERAIGPIIFDTSELPGTSKPA